MKPGRSDVELYYFAYLLCLYLDPNSELTRSPPAKLTLASALETLLAQERDAGFALKQLVLPLVNKLKADDYLTAEIEDIKPAELQKIQSRLCRYQRLLEETTPQAHAGKVKVDSTNTLVESFFARLPIQFALMLLLSLSYYFRHEKTSDIHSYDLCKQLELAITSLKPHPPFSQPPFFGTETENFVEVENLPLAVCFDLCQANLAKALMQAQANLPAEPAPEKQPQAARLQTGLNDVDDADNASQHAAQPASPEVDSYKLMSPLLRHKLKQQGFVFPEQADNSASPTQEQLDKSNSNLAPSSNSNLALNSNPNLAHINVETNQPATELEACATQAQVQVSTQQSKEQAYALAGEEAEKAAAATVGTTLNQPSASHLALEDVSALSALDLNPELNAELNPELNPELQTQLNQQLNPQLNPEAIFASLSKLKISYSDHFISQLEQDDWKKLSEEEIREQISAHAAKSQVVLLPLKLIANRKPAKKVSTSKAKPGNVALISGGKVARKIAHASPETETSLVVCASSSANQVGKAVLAQGPFVADKSYLITGKQGLALTEYLYFWLVNKQRELYERATPAGASGKIYELPAGEIDKFLIPVPSLEVQEEIAQAVRQALAVQAKLESQLEGLEACFAQAYATIYQAWVDA